MNLHSLAGDAFEDVSWSAAEALADDQYCRQNLVESYWSLDNTPPFLRKEVEAFRAKRDAERATESV